ncbi:hypothetical protein ANME2D_00147 [Candidatus Methanoperedens nitroreducens]|uniref:Uncharacterized protein n=1 Tax=Candidatus Methanoperedens nitratireducens TaxID=1392998 RepID=A0A062V973_9EURY|nr:hypothetical protein [Candidatus Methanoperedens nitroreducens]KCZ73088.1 hypothetical protein ANME2D_00147 [Candidatus Methanoperedens nitroreducens]MDJ1422966.1 hypothetical protein [Candidatus Methanoperedens sp.]
MSNDPRITILTIQLIALYGGGITGFASLIMALFPFFNGDFLSAGIYLLAAALSFGLMANAVLREGVLVR